jgi:hypothetical protein
MATYKKDPNATLDYLFDWSAWLTEVSDTITSVDWVLSSGLTEVSSSNTTTGATIFVSGGILDESETITCRITTVGGRIDDRTITLKIVSR